MSLFVTLMDTALKSFPLFRLVNRQGTTETHQERSQALFYRVAGLAIWVAGLMLRLAPIAQNRFHEDEALYAYWGLQIATGADPMLDHLPVDKPPLFLYILAFLFRLFGASEVMARIPSLVASSLTIWLAGMLARRLYGRAAALVAMVVLALNPFDISFATTAFTDPLMVFFVFMALLLMVAGRPGWAGLALGFAFATKQQGLFFVPLIAGAYGYRSGQAPRDALISYLRWHAAAALTRLWSLWWLRAIVGFVLAIAPAIGWDSARAHRPGYLVQSWVSYGGLKLADWSSLGERAGDWLAILSRFFGAPALNVAVLVGLFALVISDVLIIGRPTPAEQRQQASFDLLLIAFSLLFLAGHWLFTFNAWDRYMLGLIPVLALLISRMATLPARWMGSHGAPIRWMLPCLAILLLCMTLAGPVSLAAKGQYPAGGDHGAYQGIDRVAACVRAHVPANAVVHQQWLGWHFLYYMYGYPQTFLWYRSPSELAEHAHKWLDVPQWIVFPEWRERADAESALEAAGFALYERCRIFRQDGSISFRVFELSPVGN